MAYGIPAPMWNWAARGSRHAVVPYHDLRHADEGELRELGRENSLVQRFSKGQPM